MTRLLSVDQFKEVVWKEAIVCCDYCTTVKEKICLLAYLIFDSFKSFCFSRLCSQIGEIKKSFQERDPKTREEGLHLYTQVMQIKRKIEVSNLNGFINLKKIDRYIDRLKTFLDRYEFKEKYFQLTAERTEEQEIDFQNYRWYQASEPQQKFAILSGTGKIPFLASELPEGAVIVEQRRWKNLALVIQGKQPNLIQRIKEMFYEPLQSWILGYSGEHTGIALGKQMMLHQTANPKKGKIHKWKDESKLIPCAVFFPKVSCDLNLSDLKEKRFEIPFRQSNAVLASFVPSWYRYQEPEKIDLEQEKIQLPPMCCSTFVATILAQKGIDIGKELNKSLHVISPIDFFKAEGRTLRRLY